MKKRIATLFTALMLLSILSFANDGIIPSKELQKQFDREFAQSTSVKWEKVADFYKASFTMNDEYYTVYFDAFNNIESLSRNISTNMLTMSLQKSLKNKVSESSWIADCFEVLGADGTEHYVVVENAKEKIFYKANVDSWEVYKRMDK